MSETIIASVISAVTAIAVCVINANLNHKKLIAELEKHDRVNAYRIRELEKKQDKHNKLIERTYELERRADVSEEKLKAANHRIDDLEKREE